MFSVHPDRVVAVHEGARMQRVSVAPVRPYFLFVGTVEPRKNIPALIAAWRPLRECAELVIAGRQRDDAPAIRMEPGLTLAGEVPEERLAELYSGAVAMVYPSLYEGFGLPVVEAMQCGTPVVLSRDPALREVAGSAAIYASSHELTEAMRALLDNAQLRMQYGEAALRRGREFTWKRTASVTQEVYGEAIARSRTLA
jgi:alpha-1,3-rhamnosyl/mannosyltransferase